MSCFITKIVYDAEDRKGLVVEAFGATDEFIAQGITLVPASLLVR